MSSFKDQPSSQSISTLTQIDTNNLPKLKLSKTAKSTILTNEIKSFIVNDIMLIPHYNTMKCDLELVKHCCSMIEELNKKNVNPKIDKKGIALDIIKTLFPDLSTDQIMMIDSFIDFCCQNDLINKVSTFTKIISSLKKNSS